MQSRQQMSNNGENRPTKIDEALGLSSMSYSLRHNGVMIFVILENLRDSFI